MIAHFLSPNSNSTVSKPKKKNIIFLSPVSGTIQVIGSSHPIVALVGDDIILPCYLNSSISASDKTVEWTKYELDPRFVYVWRDGGELESKKNPSYKGRTTVSLHKLKHGDISLNLSKVRLSDRGRYRCFLPDMGETLLELIVGKKYLIFINQRSGLSLNSNTKYCQTLALYNRKVVSIHIKKVCKCAAKSISYLEFLLMKSWCTLPKEYCVLHLRGCIPTCNIACSKSQDWSCITM